MDRGEGEEGWGGGLPGAREGDDFGAQLADDVADALLAWDDLAGLAVLEDLHAADGAQQANEGAAAQTQRGKEGSPSGERAQKSGGVSELTHEAKRKV